MSYARFSSDDFRSDVYVYESADGFVLHVASNRANITEEQYAALPTAGDLTSEEGIKAYLDHNNALHQLIMTGANSEAIDHPQAGETYVLDAPGDCADKLEELRKEGFYIPQFAINTLREEQNEVDSVKTE